MALAIELGPDLGADPLMAATGIAHRVGKPALTRQLLRGPQLDPSCAEAEAQAEVEEIAVMILARPVQEVEEYYALFYRGFRPQDAKEAFQFTRQNKG